MGKFSTLLDLRLSASLISTRSRHLLSATPVRKWGLARSWPCQWQSTAVRWWFITITIWWQST